MTIFMFESAILGQIRKHTLVQNNFIYKKGCRFTFFCLLR